MNMAMEDAARLPGPFCQQLVRLLAILHAHPVVQPGDAHRQQRMVHGGNDRLVASEAQIFGELVEARVA